MTPSDLQKIADKLPLSEATRKRNLGAGGGVESSHTARDQTSCDRKNPRTEPTTLDASRSSERLSRPIRFRQRTKPLLNKLETEFRDRLRVTGVDIWEQAITFRLGNGVRYTPDLALYSDMGTFCCYEVKGPWSTDDAIVKFKMAATMYPKVHWIMAWKDDSGQWQTQEAQP